MHINTPLSNPSSQTKAVLRFWSAGRQGVIPTESVLTISLAPSPHPIPFSADLLEGITAQEGLLTPQIDWTGHWGGVPGSGKYQIRVATSRGPVGLRVDGLAHEEGYTEPETTLREVEYFVGTFAKMVPHSTFVPQPEQQLDEITLLAVACGGQRVALLAAEVSRIARPDGIWSESPDEYWVSLDGDLIPGYSLAHFLGHSVDQVNQDLGWALLISGKEGLVALLTDTVYGLINIPCHCLRRLVFAEQLKVGYLDKDHGAIEVLDPKQLLGQPSVLFSNWDFSDFPSPVLAGIFADSRYLVTKIGPYCLVFLASLVISVIRDVEERQISTSRHRRSYPLLNLSHLMEVNGKAASQRILLIQRPGRVPVAIIVDEVSMSRAPWVWQALPPLPTISHRLFSAIGWDGDGLKLQVREDLFNKKIPDTLYSCIRRAWCGWITLEN